MKEKKIVTRVSEKNRDVFESASRKILLMQEVLGDKVMIQFIGQELPTKWSKKKRKRVAKAQWVNWRISYLKENGLEVFHQ